LRKFLLDGLEALMPLAMGDLSLPFVAAFAPILVAQHLNVCNLGSETADFFSKHCQVIHLVRIAYSGK
jgi:hypothetical protein